MHESAYLLVLVVAVAIGFGFANGFNDAANAIATVVGTRALPPRYAVAMAAVFNFAGAATGTAVALTIGKGIISHEALTLPTIAAGAGAIVIWAVLATLNGLPISLTHGLVAGLLGAGIAISGADNIVWRVLWRVISAVGIAPVLGFAGGLAVMVAVMWIFRKSAPEKARGLFINLQIGAGAFMAYSHGKNDGQMPIALMSMALMVYHGSGEFQIPLWVVLVSAASISWGTATGGWRVMRTLGLGLTSLRPAEGFAATLAAASVVESASHLGIPVSTTHCISSSIMGVGATKRLSAVRWGVAGDIVLTWIITFPACGILGWLLARLLSLMFLIHG